MVGRLDDWLKVVAEKKGIIADPWVFDWAGVAVMKKAYTHLPAAGVPAAACSARRSATTCTGASSSAATS